MQVIVTLQAAKHFNKIPSIEQKKIKRKFEILEQNPYEGKKLSAELSETRAIRAWPYRILYYINQKEKKIFIINIVHRQSAYKN